MSGYTLHPGCRCPRARVELVDEEAGELILSYQRQRLNKVLQYFIQKDT